MKNLKLLAMLGALGGVLLFSTGCNSTKKPLDVKYTGAYTHNGGTIEVTKTTVSSKRGVKLPVLTVNKKQYEPTGGYYNVKWSSTSFDYFSDHSYKFTADVTATDIDSRQTTIKGKSDFRGRFGEQLETYSITIIDDYGKTNLFTKYK